MADTETITETLGALLTTYHRIWKEMRSGGKKAQKAIDKLVTCLEETCLLQTRKAQGSTDEFLDKEGFPYVLGHFIKKELFNDLWSVDTTGTLGNDKKKYLDTKETSINKTRYVNINYLTRTA